MVSRALEHMLRPLRRRLAIMVNRAVVTLVHDAHKMQELQLRVLAGETLDGVERFQNFGHTSRPLAGAEAVVLAAGGQRAHTIAVVVDDRRYRPTDLAEGESQHYNAFGDYVYLKADGTVVVNGNSRIEANAPTVEANCETATVKASTSAEIDSPATTITGQLTVQGQIVGQGGMAISGGSGASVEGDIDVTNGDVQADSISLKGHVHPGDSGGTTGTPQ